MNDYQYSDLAMKTVFASTISLGRGCIYSHSYTLSNDNAVKAELTCTMKIFSKIITESLVQFQSDPYTQSTNALTLITTE